MNLNPRLSHLFGNPIPLFSAFSVAPFSLHCLISGLIRLSVVVLHLCASVVVRLRRWTSLLVGLRIRAHRSLPSCILCSWVSASVPSSSSVSASAPSSSLVTASFLVDRRLFRRKRIDL
ncbi:hypothetical protein QN277_026311 [Acacia crassicarpa]|uniref:Uncharacterized protein n=1 Tax=Acacia crassicarpa TaxID=499986 RepID=A0AAE1JA15_9FABA|nr:hypothetical protein QN277_026311 [Acacia crassicarpa]